MSNKAVVNISLNQPSRATEVVTTTIPGAGGEDPLVVSRSVGGGAGTPGATGATGAMGPAGPAGPIGPEGPPGSAEGAFLLDQDPPQEVTGYPKLPNLTVVFIFDAGENLGGNRAVKIHSDGLAYYVSAAEPTDIGKACGITTGAATFGNPVIIQRSGLMTEPSWTWVPGPVYVGVNGQLTQTPPASGFIQPIGEAVTAVSIFIQPWPAIQLAA